MPTKICSNCQKENVSIAKYCSNCGKALETRDSELFEAALAEVAPKKKFKPFVLLGLVFGIMVMFAVAYLVQYRLLVSPSFDTVMMKAVSDINATCPIMVDKLTRLDNAIALPDNTIQYNYTVLEMQSSQIDTVAFRKQIFPNILNNVKTNPSFKIFRDNAAVLIYAYRDKDGLFIQQFAITAAMYQ